MTVGVATAPSGACESAHPTLMRLRLAVPAARRDATGERRDRIDALLHAIGRAAADRETTGDRGRDRTRPHAGQRRRIDAASSRRRLIAQMRHRLRHVPSHAATRPRCARPRQQLAADVHRALDQMRRGLLGGRDRQQPRDLLAPQVQPLIQRAAARAGREMQLGARASRGPASPNASARPAAHPRRTLDRRAATSSLAADGQDLLHSTA